MNGCHVSPGDTRPARGGHRGGEVVGEPWTRSPAETACPEDLTGLRGPSLPAGSDPSLVEWPKALRPLPRGRAALH